MCVCIFFLTAAFMYIYIGIYLYIYIKVSVTNKINVYLKKTTPPFLISRSCDFFGFGFLHLLKNKTSMILATDQNYINKNQSGGSHWKS